MIKLLFEVATVSSPKVHSSGIFSVLQFLQGPVPDNFV
jgi:hypothetical protein